MQILSLVLALLVELHPFLVTAVVAIALLWAYLRFHKQRRFRIAFWAVFAALATYYVADYWVSSPRVAYAHSIPDKPIINEVIPTPRSIVLVNHGCDHNCFQRLVDGTHDEVIVAPSGGRAGKSRPPRRYRLKRRASGVCTRLNTSEELDWLRVSADDVCLVIEEVEMPTAGIFIVRGSFWAIRQKPAADYVPGPLTLRPPGPMIRFTGVEVQRRSASGIEVLAQSQAYMAPGRLGLPPLIGCWIRPDNVIWTLPEGDAGCGLWRPLVGGGRIGRQQDDWVYSDAFHDRSQP